MAQSATVRSPARLRPAPPSLRLGCLASSSTFLRLRPVTRGCLRDLRRGDEDDGLWKSPGTCVLLGPRLPPSKVVEPSEAAGILHFDDLRRSRSCLPSTPTRGSSGTGTGCSGRSRLTRKAHGSKMLRLSALRRGRRASMPGDRRARTFAFGRGDRRGKLDGSAGRTWMPVTWRCRAWLGIGNFAERPDRPGAATRARWQSSRSPGEVSRYKRGTG